MDAWECVLQVCISAWNNASRLLIQSCSTSGCIYVSTNWMFYSLNFSPSRSVCCKIVLCIIFCMYLTIMPGSQNNALHCIALEQTVKRPLRWCVCLPQLRLVLTHSANEINASVFRSVNVIYAECVGNFGENILRPGSNLFQSIHCCAL